ncbi:putative PhzF superfamily epimerase YddE/YHI9 [Lysobacter niabensis]|uniref:PhzF superfamily epimerase YddE/YHI9 n=1 Tax=Agrilutibacter niabensis TaxID=380628 RepID=A0ABU1VK12_9GAMM|nr:putative PhzF superfamily epimerase YddE/YHI9 [Lysobacter niabensis]
MWIKRAPIRSASSHSFVGRGGEGCYLFSMEPHGDDLTAYARFFNPTVGLWEDSATGTAAGTARSFPRYPSPGRNRSIDRH